MQGRCLNILSSASNVLKTPWDAYLGAEKFFHYSCPTTMGSSLTILIVDFEHVVSRAVIFQNCIIWLIGILKRLFEPEKNFATMITRL